MDSAAVRTAIHWLVRAGKNFGLAVNGVAHLIETGLAKEGGLYEALVRLRDVSGDPPITYPLYTCVDCGKRWNVEDLVVNELFPCSCGNFYRYEEIIEPVLKANLNETWDLSGNYLKFTLKNMQNRTVWYSMNLLKNGQVIDLWVSEYWKLASKEQKTLEIPHGQAWEHSDKLQAEIWDRDTGEFYGRSNETTWSDRPWAPLVATIGFGAIATIIRWLLTLITREGAEELVVPP